MSLQVFKNEYIEIYKKSKFFFIKSLKQGFSLERFNDLLTREFPYINITSFAAVKNSLLFAPSDPVIFGEERERVSISVAENGVKAYITLYVPKEDLSSDRRSDLSKEIIDALNKAGIVYGVKN